MKLDTLQKVLIGGILAGAGYLAYKKFKKTSDTSDSGSSSAAKNSGATNNTPVFTKYTVNTILGSLNIRESASVTASVVGKLAKGTQIFAKPSSTSGWSEYSKDGIMSNGYVYSQYLKKVS